MEMKYFTWERDVKPAFERAIALKGADYVYERMNTDGITHCVNWVLDENGEKVPSCLVGHVLMDLVPDCEIGQFSGSGDSIWRIKNSGMAAFDTFSQLVMSFAQGRQDTGYSWGEALSKSIDEADKFNNNSKGN